MKLQLLYNEYLNIKFNRKLQSGQTDCFEYCLCEDGSAELFFIARKDELFIEWAYELQPKDPNYTVNPDWKPVLSAFFKHLDVYDELILYYLLFTINATMSIVKINSFNAMNDFMKNYCFFQLAQLTDASRLNDEQRHQLRDFFFFFYLYAHPVNEETLYSFSFSGQDLVHTKTNIHMEHYFSIYHDYYSENLDKYRDKLFIAPHEINACKNLTMELLGSIEGKSTKLAMPPEEGLEFVLQLINDVDYLIHIYSENKATLFSIMRDFLSDNRSNPYRDHCFSTLLQNYVSYILYFKFDEIHDLVDYFKGTPLWCGMIINKIFTDAIFIQKIMKQNHIDITEYKNVIEFFDEEARRIYL
ncbi:hypothetical protein [Aneurinibacillus aneurinilyticus]|jgi:hypothetical protein|uniref:Uncharacterized protein n=2 Tax=Aneurinibacillus aneurinilyticus TaxID=1391 RepID=A0A848CY49_ANEAE|nr:hypothetical protein [Aneurinibacillus aneurinilyticus]ERI04961.1 hypothetical protein HMPREF0083_05864 [Aneurinibacillus aneurinilyticus ATCC 12856]MCI1696331.1 hypothetical protein [Aneurinibacillus aneurinilyticus]MED0673507.1 hypothetical protein [Aneurinibacillus aneurinilyticus]MED0708360.1 hypothetical protein [Aneurinibacillus aneurinilyticus]MED0726559.1 hypothetical protein [Aneurinibacillus aneurinilyticus]